MLFLKSKNIFFFFSIIIFIKLFINFKFFSNNSSNCLKIICLFSNEGINLLSIISFIEGLDSGSRRVHFKINLAAFLPQTSSKSGGKIDF